MKQFQRKRSRVALLFGLASILAALVVIVNVLGSSQVFESASTTPTTTTATLSTASLDSSSPPARKYERPKGQKDRFERQVTVVEYDDYIDDERQLEQKIEKESSSSSSPQWTPEQVKEMEGYYKRYLEVFHKTHGYDYEPESMEVVYTEYLRFRERKAREYYEKEALEDYKQKKAQEEEQQKQERAQLVAQEEAKHTEQEAEVVELFNETASKTERNLVADQIMVKPAPFELEIGLKEQQQMEDEEDLYNKNCTEPITNIVVATPTTIAIR